MNQAEHSDTKKVLNHALTIMDQEVSRAKREMSNIRPNLEEVRLRVEVADDAITMVAELLLRLINNGTPEPITVSERVNNANAVLIAVARDLRSYLDIIQRANAQPSNSAAN